MITDDDDDDGGTEAPDGDEAATEAALDSLAILEEEQAIRERLRVDPNCLDDDLSRAASDIAYLGGRAARAQLAHGKAKIGMKRQRGLVYLASKDIAVQELGPRGATVDLINAMVDSDPRYVRAAELEAEADARSSVAKTNVEAAKARKDMLVQVASTRRMEMEREAYVMKRNRD